MATIDEASVPTKSPGRRWGKIWKRIDSVCRLVIAAWVIPALFIANNLSDRGKDREAVSQRERVRHEQRVAEADLARNLLPLLLRPGTERDLALRLISWVEPDHATSLLDALQAAGEPIETETAAVVRATSASRKATLAFEDAVTDAQTLRDHGNHPEAFRALRTVYDGLPAALKARVNAPRVDAAASAYARGEYESASRMLDEALAPAIAAPLPGAEGKLAAEEIHQP
jgi:hypothetical protein